jgi:cytochrome b561
LKHKEPIVVTKPSIRVNPQERYGSGAVLFHWSTFVLVLIVGTLGLLHDSWPRATQAFWINVHALIGLLVWVLLIARALWRWRHSPPALPADLGDFTRRAAAAVHGALYLLLFVIPILGIVTFVWHGRVFDFGLFQVDFGVKKNRAIFHPTEDVHGYLAYLLFGLVAIHAAAALWHHFVARDGVLRRMWPAGRRAA